MTASDPIRGGLLRRQPLVIVCLLALGVAHDHWDEEARLVDRRLGTGGTLDNGENNSGQTDLLKAVERNRNAESAIMLSSGAESLARGCGPPLRTQHYGLAVGERQLI